MSMFWENIDVLEASIPYPRSTVQHSNPRRSLAAYVLTILGADTLPHDPCQGLAVH
ncbi:unnamed protein product, partial [Nesidiocoris tenuis]